MFKDGLFKCDPCVEGQDCYAWLKAHDKYRRQLDPTTINMPDMVCS